MVRGLIHSWKIAVAYYISAGSIHGGALKSLLLNVISKLQSTGLNVRAVVSDQGSNNRNVMKSLVSSENSPYFFHNDKKIYYIFDFPHLVKSVRNNLINHDVYIGDDKISWNDIVSLYKIDLTSRTARACPKLTNRHIFPNNFEKMRVKLAMQVFSHTVASALKTALETKQLKSTTAACTADFIAKMNGIIDCLNSKALICANPYNCVISNFRPEVNATLEEAVV